MNLATAAFVILATGVCAQPISAPADPPAVFEVASIKRTIPSPPGAHDTGAGLGFKQGFRLTATEVSVRYLIERAYDVREFQVSGGPGWMDSDRYDVNAKPGAETVAAIEKLRGDPVARKSMLDGMFQALLADRFRLKLNRETRQMPVYDLVIARGGSKLKENTTPGDTQGGGSGGEARLQITGTRMELAWLVQNLSDTLQRPVIDRTGLNGKYDYSLEWTPDETRGTGPSIFAALQEQLGLKLDSVRAPVEILVVDHVEKPTEN